jgi:hypothetical protein
VRHRRPLALALLSAATSVVLLPTAASPASAAPVASTKAAPLGKAIEGLSPYQAQTTCSPTAKPGVTAFTSIVLKAYPGTGSSGIVRACSVGGRSEHKEGRAWDWRLNHANATQRAQASNLTAWLFATDRYGNRFANARRLGVMYVIWNGKIWSSYKASSGWQPYSGSSPHRDHMHVSFSWAGALKRTSYWSGKVSGVVAAPGAPAPTPPKPVVPAVPKPSAAPSVTPSVVPTLPAPALPAPGVPGSTTPFLDSGSASLRVSAADPTGDETSVWLRAGRRYRVTSTGTYRYGPAAADAECSERPADGRWHPTSQWEGAGSRGHLDLSVSFAEGDWTPVGETNSRGCSRSRTWTRVVLATADGPLRAKVVDDAYGDNSGSLQLVVTTLDTATSHD